MAVVAAAAVDSHGRSLAKALSWRIIATLTTATIAFIVTGEINTAALIGGIEFLVKFVVYYLHERAWHFFPEHERSDDFDGGKVEANLSAGVGGGGTGSVTAAYERYQDDAPGIESGRVQPGLA